jgi:hypothetical protein
MRSIFRHYECFVLLRNQKQPGLQGASVTLIFKAKAVIEAKPSRSSSIKVLHRDLLTHHFVKWAIAVSPQQGRRSDAQSITPLNEPSSFVTL